jgi:hypothetical protein
VGGRILGAREEVGKEVREYKRSRGGGGEGGGKVERRVGRMI